MTRPLQIALAVVEGIALMAIIGGAFAAAALARLAFAG
jgi:hypothetical protein